MESEPEVRILIVDDRPDKAKALQILIADLGRVITVFSGREALRCLLQQDFALILLDVNMPDMDGFETAALIRQRPSFERTPIIFITSFHDGDNHASRGYSLGAVDYILAPVIPDVLRAKVSVFADLYRKTHEVKRRAEERLLLLQEQAARSQAEDNERRATFLASASRLLGSSMDTSQLLGSLSNLISQRFADWCCIDLLSEDGSLKRRACSTTKGENSRELDVPVRDWPIQNDLSALLISDARNITLLPPEIRAPVVELKVDSLLVAPVHARGQKMGYLILGREHDLQRRFDNFDAATAEDLAQRIGIALLHAAIYHEAQEANRIKDEFLAVVSHELRTPLTPVLGWTRILTSNALDAPTIKRGLDVIDRNIKAQSKLIDDLLDISRIITGKLRLNLRKVELHRVIHMAIDSLRPAALAKSIGLVAQVDDSLEIVVDPSRLQQVLWNLLFNAIKFTPSQGQIHIGCRRVDQHAEIVVSDNGRGINPRFLPFVFDRFRQADSSSTRSDGGLGIGLSITQQIVELHGGTVAVASAGEGRGATFTVRLPLAMPETLSEDTPVSPPDWYQSGREQPTLEKLHILVVDDNSDARDLLTLMLERAGARVTARESAQSGLAVLNEQRIDLLLCDLAMPNEDGFQMIQKVRAHPKGHNLPSIALSAYCREQDVQAALKSGFNQHIAKPIEPGELFSSILALTSNSSQRASRNTDGLAAQK